MEMRNLNIVYVISLRDDDLIHVVCQGYRLLTLLEGLILVTLHLTQESIYQKYTSFKMNKLVHPKITQVTFVFFNLI